MAEWSFDRVYVMPLVDDEQDVSQLEEAKRALLSNLAFDPIGEWFYYIDSIKFTGPALVISGSGKWGTGIGFSKECLEHLSKGIVIYESSIWGHGSASIDIRGERVFQTNDDEMMSPLPWMHFEGRNNQERGLLARLRDSLNDEIRERIQHLNRQLELNVVEYEVMRLKLKREGRLQ